MDRRDFIKSVAGASAVAATIPLIDISASAQVPAAGKQSKVIVATGKDYAAITAKAIAALGGIGAFVKAGDKVVVKPNIGWDRNVEQAANTHPIVVKTIVELALKAGAKKVMVFDRSCNDARRCYNNSGILAAVESIKDPRATCTYVANEDFIPVQIKNGVAIQEWDLYRDAVEADCYINVPIAKHHGLAKLTMGLKNIMGICGGKRGLIHQQIGEKLTDLNMAVRSKFTVIDATRILLRNGPQGGKLDDVKVLDTVIASTDPVAADAYTTTLFNMKPEQIDAVVAAHKRGMGEMDLAKINVVKVA